MKNKAAVALGELRKKKAEDGTLPSYEAIGAAGGAKRAENMTVKQRKSSSQRALQARWARWRKANGKPSKPGDEEVLKEAEGK